MRRPVKPFVTEYKGTARRQGGAIGGAGRDDDEARPFGDVRSFGVAAPDDGYEAALRAADALFSGSPGKAPESRDRLAEAPSPEADVVSSPGKTVSSAGRGRVLQAIEAPSPVETEVEGPRRRGRKPGSKNKPKPAAPQPTIASPELIAAYEARLAETVAPPVRPTFATPDRPVVQPRPVSRPPVIPPETPRAEPRTRIRSADGRVDPFFWVRKTLKPGENWKRRLPKVIW